MLRLSALAARRLGARSNHLVGCRNASSGGGGGGGGAGKAIAGTLLISAGLGGGVVGYAAFDDEFRKTLEESVPGSGDLLNTLLGPAVPPPVPKPVPSKLRIPGPVVVTKPKESIQQSEELPPLKLSPKEEEDKPINLAVPPAPVLELPPLEELPPLAEPPAPVLAPEPKAAPEPVSAPAPVPEPLVVEDVPEPTNVHITEDQELTPDVENSSLDQVLHELGKEMKSSAAAAVQGYDKSVDAVVAHISIMQKVLDSNLAARDDDAWNEVFEAATTKSEALRFAELKDREATAAIKNVLESIDAGRRNKSTATNPQLIVAEEAANRALYQIEQARARITTVEGEARVVEHYRDLVEEGRQQFHREMASIMPDVKLGEKTSKLSEDELNMFITHAYRKVLHLQQELAKQQTLEQQRFKQALEKQRIEAQMSAVEKTDTELERQKRELEVEHQRRLASLREDTEAELRTQLRRQAAAHSDHLADVLTVQESELRRKHEHSLNEQLSSAQSDYLNKVSGFTGSLAGLSAALEARAEADKSSVTAQKLWLACVSLEDSIRQGNTEAGSFEESAKPLGTVVSSIKSLSGSDEFVSAVVSGVPEVALARGVFTEQVLRDRFNKVDSVARRVGSVGDEGASLIGYGLSYLQSMLLVDTAVRTPTVSDLPLDVEQLSTQDILAQARFSLERGDLISAVQFMGLLKGEPRRVAKDWLSEARLHLEAKQASQALLAHAAAVGLETLPKE